MASSLCVLFLLLSLALPRASAQTYASNYAIYQSEITSSSSCSLPSATSGCVCPGPFVVAPWKIFTTSNGAMSPTAYATGTLIQATAAAKPLQAGQVTRSECCALCSGANSNATLGLLCNYWQHYVPPAKTLTAGSGSTCSSASAGLSGKCGYCILFPTTAAAPTCCAAPIVSTSANYSSVGKGALATSCSGVNGDPHMVGARGEKFDFNGELGKSFCLLSDVALHVNVLLDGYKDNEGGIHSWVKAISFLWKDMAGKKHSVMLAARQGKEQKRGQHGFLQSVTADGVSLPTPAKSGDMVEVDGDFTLFLLDSDDVVAGGLEREVYILTIGDVLDAEIHLKPEHALLRTPTDALVHFDFQIKKLKSTPQVHGILGQTYRSGLDRLMRTAEYSLLSFLQGDSVSADGASGAGILDGHTKDYLTSDLMSPDCSFAQAWSE